jgi:archaeal flagellar protein FlaJ
LPLIKTLETWSFRYFGRFAPLLGKAFPVKGSLEKGNIKIFPETYLSLMLFTAVLTLPISATGIVLFLITGFAALLILVPLPIFIMLGFIMIPKSKASDRASNLDREMPFAAAYISVMSSGGIAPYTSFKRLSVVELMPAMRMESREIIKDVEIFGIDPLSALEHAAKKTPLDGFKDFLGGYASTVIIGGDIVHFLERKAEDIFKGRALKVKAAAERLGMLLETFIIVMVMMSLCFYILFSVQQISSGSGVSDGGASVYSGILMYTFIFTPMLSMLFIYLAHSMQPKSPVIEMKPYKVFGVCGVIALVMFMLLTNFIGLTEIPLFTQIQAMGIDLPVAMSLSLFVATAPAAVVYMRIARKRSSMENGVNNFLRDLTEVRKTGLSPERCIESLSKRDYGTFTPELRKISSDISWGIPIKQVMMDFLKRTKSWMVQIVMFLLVETIDVGGGTIGMIEALSRFNNLTHEVEKEKKMSTRPYVFMPYLAAILLVATTVMMTGLTSGFGLSAVAGPPDPAAIAASANMTNIFVTSAIFHSFLIGIVAGKISDESIASGFKHAAILVIISMLAAKLIPQFIKLG